MFFELLFPKRCAVCDTPLVRGEKTVCLNCLLQSPYMSDAFAKYHSRITTMEVENIDIFLNYGYCEKAIADFKYRSNLYKGRILGKMWAEHLKTKEWISQTDVIVPVPLHPLKLRKRGFNQSEFLGRVLSKHLGIPLCTNAIRRHRNNSPQVGNDNRWLNVKEIFSPHRTQKLKNKHILVIDDLITTSATSSEVLNALKEVEGLRVSLAFLASPS